MGVTKSQLFTEEQNEIATIARVLGHPARIAILQHLLKANQCINSDLVQELGLAQATISQHLKELKNIGLLQGTVEGTSMCYCINPETWKDVEQKLSTLFSHYTDKLNCC